MGKSDIEKAIEEIREVRLADEAKLNKIREVIAIINMNWSSDTWEEAKIFESNQPISDILNWVKVKCGSENQKKITITVPGE